MNQPSKTCKTLGKIQRWFENITHICELLFWSYTHRKALFKGVKNLLVRDLALFALSSYFSGSEIGLYASYWHLYKIDYGRRVHASSHIRFLEAI